MFLLDASLNLGHILIIQEPFLLQNLDQFLRIRVAHIKSAGPCPLRKQQDEAQNHHSSKIRNSSDSPLGHHQSPFSKIFLKSLHQRQCPGFRPRGPARNNRSGSDPAVTDNLHWLRLPKGCPHCYLWKYSLAEKV